MPDEAGEAGPRFGSTASVLAIGSPCLGVCTHCDPIMSLPDGAFGSTASSTAPAAASAACCCAEGGLASDSTAVPADADADAAESTGWDAAPPSPVLAVGSPCLGICTHCDPIMSLDAAPPSPRLPANRAASLRWTLSRRFDLNTGRNPPPAAAAAAAPSAAGSPCWEALLLPPPPLPPSPAASAY
jgi:hypothetical protein